MMLWWLLQNALGATVLAGVAALISRTFRLGPSTRHALWLVVIVKLLAPPLLLWSCPWEAAASTPSASTALAPGDASTAGIDALSLLVWVWLAGTAAMALFQGLRLADLYVRLRGGHEAPEWMRDEASRLADRLGVKPPRLVVAASIGSPLLVGGFRPRLVVPEALLGRLDAAAWRSVLTHEMAHLKRRDNWIGWVELAASCAWWWNPVFWHARRRLRENAEFACDAWVVRILPEGRRGYAESLIAVVDTFAWKPAPVAAIGMAAGGKRIFERRLEMILREAVPHRMSPLATAAALLTALMVLPGWSHPYASSTETAIQAPRAAAAPQEAVAPPVAVATAREIAETPAKTVEAAKPSKPAARPVHKAKRPVAAPVRHERKLQKTEKVVDAAPAKAAPAPVERPQVAELTNTVPAPEAVATPIVKDVFNTHKEGKSSTLQNVQVHGEVRIRAQRFSSH